MTSLDGTMLLELLASGVAKKLKVTRFFLDVFLDRCIVETGQVKAKESQLLHSFDPLTLSLNSVLQSGQIFRGD